VIKINLIIQKYPDILLIMKGREENEENPLEFKS